MRLGLALMGVLAISVTACGKPEPAGPPVLVEQLQVEPMIYWSSGLNGRRVSIDGYVGFDNGAGGDAIAIGERLFTSPNGGGQQLMRFELERGDGPNQLKLAETSRQSMPGMPAAPGFVTFDIDKTTVQDSAGKPHPLSERLRLSGKLVYQSVGNRGLMWDDDPRSPTGKRLRPMLEDVTVEAVPAG